ncbi:MAG: hypothetical protein IPK22_05055 [Verrucomicrobiaceae bacterium]|nr:hypothetical protein [Verrucomicrobiaceae bacterium]
MKLNALLKTLGFLALAATPVVAGTAPAPKNPAPVQPAINDDLGINVGLGYHSSYVWRGLNFGQHWVDGSLGGAIPLVEGTRLAWDVNYGSLASDQSTFGGANNRSFQRLQLGAALQHDLGPVTASLGYRYFRNMGTLNTLGGMRDGNEFSFGLATALGPINLASSANYDISNASWYFDLDANTNIAITDSISLVPFVNVGYGKNFAWQLVRSENNFTGWTAVTTGLRLPVKLNSRTTLTPYIAVNAPLGQLDNSAVLPINTTQPVVFGGVTLSVRF